MKASYQKIKQLQGVELQNLNQDIQKEMERNQNTLTKMYRLADLLQSNIPSRDKWRDVFLSFAN